MSIIVLIIVCLIMLLRPVLGVAVYLVLYNSIFCLAIRLYWSLPKRMFLLVYTALCLGALLGARIDRQRMPPDESDRMRLRQARRVIAWALLPYLGWLTGAVILGVVEGNAFASSAMSFLGGALLPFVLVPVILLLRRRRLAIMRAVAAVTVVTAAVHLVVSLSGSRSLLFEAYYWSMGETDYFANWIMEVEGRGIPQGIFLFLFGGTFCFASLLTPGGRRGHKMGMGLLALGAVLAVMMTVARGPMLSLGVGFLSAVALVFTIREARPSLVKKTLLVSAVIVTAVWVTVIRVPEAGERWMQRLSSLGDEVDALFRPTQIYGAYHENVRGLENFVAMRLLSEKPFIGWGTLDVMMENTLIEDPEHSGRDVHSILKMGVIGGVPLMLLYLWMYAALFFGFWSLSRGNHRLRVCLIPFLCVVATSGFINLLGLGRLFGAETAPFAVFVSLMAAQFVAFRSDASGGSAPRASGAATPLTVADANEGGPS